MGLRESPRRRADAIAATTSRRWRRIATMSSRRSYGLQPVASMAWGAQNLIPTQGVNTKPNNAFDIFRAACMFSLKKQKPKGVAAASQRQASPRMLDVQPSEPRAYRQRNGPARGQAAFCWLSSSSGRVGSGRRRPSRSSCSRLRTGGSERHLSSSEKPRSRSTSTRPPRRRNGATGRRLRSSRRRSGSSPPRRARRCECGRPRLSRVPGVGWVHGVVEGVVVGRRLITDDTVTISGMRCHEGRAGRLGAQDGAGVQGPRASSRRRARRTRTRRPRSPTTLLLGARSRWSADCLLPLGCSRSPFDSLGALRP